MHELNEYECRLFAQMVRQTDRALNGLGAAMLHTAQTLRPIAGAERMSGIMSVLGSLMTGFAEDIVREAGTVLAPIFGEGIDIHDPRLDT
jgi:hypothetical protein